MSTSLVTGRRDQRGEAVRAVRRRRAVPSGRALAGGLLVAAAAVLVFAAWLGASGRPGRPWVIARVPLAAGTTLAPGELTTAPMSLAPATGDHAYSDPAALVGRTLAAPLAAGELVQSAALVPAGAQPALRPVAVSVDPAEASVLLTGSLVDVLVTDGSGPSSPTTVVARGARVISVAQAASNLASQSAGTVVTLGVSSLPEVTAIVHAERTGTLSVVVGEPSDGAGLGAGAAGGAGAGGGPAGGAGTGSGPGG